MSLVSCNNYNLLEHLESPGKGTNTTGGIIALYLFPTSSTTDGNVKDAFGTAREGADALCLNTRAGITFPNNGCNRVRAMISLSATDAIANMPNNYGIPTDRPIYAPDGFTQAADWFTLVSGTSGNALAPHVMPATSWWSFSTNGGNYDNTNNCSGGTIGTSVNGVTADSSTTGANWLAAGVVGGCSIFLQLLCICY
ncbi:MAG: hypothetical protein OHK0011_24720 [Turneriella sp.]